MRVWGKTSHGGFSFACLSGQVEVEVEDHPLPWPKRWSFLLGIANQASQNHLTVIWSLPFPPSLPGQWR